MGWAACTTVISCPEADAKRCWETIGRPEDVPNYDNDDYVHDTRSYWSIDCVHDISRQDGVRRIQKTGPHCGMSDPLIEEMAKMPEFRDLGVQVSSGGEVSNIVDVAFPRDGYEGPIKFWGYECDPGQESRFWWMVPASAVFRGGAGAPSAPAPCACGQRTHLPGARFGCGCAAKLPDAETTAAVAALRKRVRGDLQGLQKLLRDMKFKHESPHKEYADEQAATIGRFVLQADADLVRPLAALECNRTLMQAVSSAKSAFEDWQDHRHEIENSRSTSDYVDEYYGLDGYYYDDEDEGYPTRLCRNYIRGQHCRFGASCKFLHSFEKCGPDCRECTFIELMVLRQADTYMGRDLGGPADRKRSIRFGC